MTSQTRTLSISQLLGLALYVPAFAMPAVDTMSGWQCAVTVSRTFLTLPKEPGALILIAIALVNPAFVGYLLAGFVPRARVARPYLVLLAFVGLACTWFFLFSNADGFRIRIGHMFWVSGMLLTVAPEVAGWSLSFGRDSR